MKRILFGLLMAVMPSFAADLPLYMVIDLSGGETAESYPVTYLDEPPSGGFNVDPYKTTKLALRRIDPGTFMMCGQYQTTLTKPYYIGVFEVTQKQYELVMGSNPSEYTGDTRPVEQISYEMIRSPYAGEEWPSSSMVYEKSFIGSLRARTRLDFDLPTEAQWEYACRAGTTSSFNNGGNSESDLNQLGRYSGNRTDGKGAYTDAHTTVGSYLPNVWGLYDMHGNVREWCLDWFGSLNEELTDPRGAPSGENRLIRGGAWNSEPSSCKSGTRGNYNPSVPREDFGFRLSLSPAYVISFDANGGNGTMPNLMEFALGADIALPENAFTRDGWHFAGWATSPDGPVEYGNCSTVAGGFCADYGTTMTLYARWAEETYTIHFDANGGTGTMADQTIAIDLPTTLDKGTFTKANCLMLGWATRPNGQPAIQDGVNAESIAALPNEVVTLYAVWREITGDGNGLSVKYYDIESSGYSVWLQSETSMRRYFAQLSPTIATNTFGWCETLQSGFQDNSEVALIFAEYPGLWLDASINTNRYNGKYANSSQDYFAMFFDGRINIDIEGEYTFAACSDDRIVLFIDGTRVCASHGWGLPSKGAIFLSAGMHRISIATYEGYASQGMFVSWKKPDDTAFSPLPQSVLFNNLCLPTVISVKQRYPWNGNVDIKFDLAGADNSQCPVSISVKDMMGNTNIQMRTVYDVCDSVVSVSCETLQPVICHWIWDAASDLPKDFKCDRVKVMIHTSVAIGASEEFRMDLSRMGQWEMRTAETNEAITYSSEWATNALMGANAVVKICPAKREKPKYVAIDLSGGPSATRYPLEYLDEIPGGAWSDEYKTSKLILRHIPAGSFIMGGRATDCPGSTVDTNLHQVVITKDFYMGVFEVTQRQWELMMGNRPSAFSNETCYAKRPVECVSYVDIRGSVKGVNWPNSKEVDENSFMGVLRNKSGLTGFDLPTEAQWEYACRAGTTTAYNSGKNIDVPYERGQSANANEVARYYGNSGGYDSNTQNTVSVDKSCSIDKGTAIVGSYLENAYGLYDMHGNVWEFCLDAITNLNASGCIDPVGDGCGLGWRVYRGGSYMNSPGGIRSANRWTATSTRPFGGCNENEHRDQIGFRLCLQGGELPELDSGTVLVNEPGEGAAIWTPTKAGIYYLTHETRTNGVNGAELLGAWFEVPGPTADNISILAQGDLAPGVTIRLGGVPDGWTLHYTTDGSEPTAASPAYTGPFTLSESATVKAVAVNDDLGWTTDVAEQRFDLPPPLAVTGAQARQRYPWDGLVDVDFTLVGDTAKCYRVSLDVADLDGGTNLAARTVWEDGGTLTNAALDVAPGTHRFVWNAGADLPEGFVADRVAVSLRAESLHDTALYMVVDLSGGPDAAHYPVSYLPDVPEGGWTDEYKTDKLVLRRIEPGWFTMGTRETDYPGATNTQRNVILTQPNYASVFEMTQRQWQKILGGNPSMYLGDVRPVDRATYDMVRGSNLGTNWPVSFIVDASSLIGTLRRRVPGALFDLPTSAQWEYACRAGTPTALNSNKDILSTGGDCANTAEVGRYCGNSGWLWNSTQKDRIPYGEYDERGGYDRSSNVGTYLPNRWGLYDMHGNLWEWCLDWQVSAQGSDEIDPRGSARGEQRIIRGGAWDSLAIGIPSGNDRESRNVDNDSVVMGFRLFLHNAPAVVEAPIVAPENLTATTNRTGDVTLSWKPLSGAYAYQIRRSKTGAFEDGTWLNTVTNTAYADWTAEAHTDYAYWVRAQFESGKVGQWSEEADGRRDGN